MLPEHRYPQAEITEAFARDMLRGALDHGVVRRLHGNAGVEHRHLALPLEEYAGLEDFGAVQRRLHRGRRRARRPRRRRRAQGGRPDARTTST